MALTFNEDRNDTIAAIATGLTQSGIGIIRISGPDAIQVGDRIAKTRKGKRVSDFEPSVMHFCDITDPYTKEKLDECLVTAFHAPHSYTTEDTVEISTHGGVYVMNEVLSLCLRQGARLAEPGEFTKRAFLGGRIDLTQAEAVMDLISSENDFARKTALRQMDGALKDEIESIRERILHEEAFIESALDDPENYSMDGYPEKLKRICSDLVDSLNAMILRSRNGRVPRTGVRTVIVGKPNAGKSSLLNYLTGEERAIVTDVPGTTRDTLEEKVRLGDVELVLTDTAGIHETDDAVERIGVERATKALDDADLVLYLIDSADGITGEDEKIATLIAKRVLSGNTRCIVLFNKSDLPGRVSDEDTKRLFRIAMTGAGKAPDEVINYRKIDSLHISVKDGTGLSDLKDKIGQMFRTGELLSSNEVLLTSGRQLQEAVKARDSLLLVMQSIEKGMTEEVYSPDLMAAYAALGRITGEQVEDDLVEKIFSEFCLGK